MGAALIQMWCPSSKFLKPDAYRAQSMQQLNDCQPALETAHGLHAHNRHDLQSVMISFSEIS